jgi:hypothetical protein
VLPGDEHLRDVPVVRLARGMGRPMREPLTAAAYAPADDPLLDAADAWACVCSQVQQAGEAERRELDAATSAAYE